MKIKKRSKPNILSMASGLNGINQVILPSINISTASSSPGTVQYGAGSSGGGGYGGVSGGGIASAGYVYPNPGSASYATGGVYYQSPPHDVVQEIQQRFPYQAMFHSEEDVWRFARKQGLKEDVDLRTIPGYQYVWFLDINDMHRYDRWILKQGYRSRVVGSFSEFVKDKYDVSMYRKTNGLRTRIKVYPAQDRFDDMYYEIMDFFADTEYNMPVSGDLFMKAMFVPQQSEGCFILFLKDDGDAARLKFILDSKELADEIEFL